jgi:type III restriction enzyme
MYPDSVFGLQCRGQGQRLLLLETKGLHLAGEDTKYKLGLMRRLNEAFADERGASIGTLELQGAGAALRLKAQRHPSCRARSCSTS